ncbi:MAG: hypothetical protein K0S27_1425 [Gammaproteobacteria bacterium]|jgi:hypothetical protein|nr:hypothetical protein [Gammaproteobacteria bacterium]
MGTLQQDISSLTFERLRKPMQPITDYLLKCIGAQKSAQVVAIQQIKKGEAPEETA